MWTYRSTQNLQNLSNWCFWRVDSFLFCRTVVLARARKRYRICRCWSKQHLRGTRNGMLVDELPFRTEIKATFWQQTNLNFYLYWSYLQCGWSSKPRTNMSGLYPYHRRNCESLNSSVMFQQVYNDNTFVKWVLHLQSTLTVIRWLTAGGTPFDATHK